MSREPTWLQEGSPHVWRPYCQHATAPAPLPVASAKGCTLHLSDGRALVDGIASWWTAAHGYGHPHVKARVQAQLEALAHVAFGGLAHEAAYTLAARIAKMLPSPLTRVFFVESGSVSVEVAIKIAVQSSSNRGVSHRKKIVCFENGYHGDTFATMSLSDPVSGMHHAFKGTGLDAVCLPLPREGDDAFDRAFRAISHEVAAVIIEPLAQCAGGMRFHEPAVLSRLRAVCDESGAALIFDEIATGFFRLGAPFAMSRTGVVPDLVTLGKALTGGTLPLACVVASEALFDAFMSNKSEHALQHGPTYMGNALACAAAHASLDLFERADYAAMVTTLENKLREGLAPLASHPDVIDVRCKGAIGAIEMRPGTAPISQAFVDRGAFVRPLRLPHTDVVYLAPPLVIDDPDLAVLTRAVHDALA